jgi:hypothetical protein
MHNIIFQVTFHHIQLDPSADFGQAELRRRGLPLGGRRYHHFFSFFLAPQPHDVGMTHDRRLRGGWANECTCPNLSSSRHRAAITDPN